MKNTEWGAVAYFAQSKYGRNGTEISQNQCSTYITGAGPGLGESTISNTAYDYDETNFESTYSYTTNQGKLSSSTGNVTGIYDLSGGTHESVAACLITNSTFITKDEKTVDLYKVGDPNNELNNYEANKDKYGDALWETSSSVSNNNAWNQNRSSFLTSKLAVFKRGGNNNLTGTGSFFFYQGAVAGLGPVSFRPVLVVF